MANVRCGLGAFGIFTLHATVLDDVVVVVGFDDEFDDDVDEVDEDVEDVDDAGVLFSVELVDVLPPIFSSVYVELSLEIILLFTTIGLAIDLFAEKLAFDPFLRWLRLIPIMGVAI